MEELKSILSRAVTFVIVILVIILVGFWDRFSEEKHSERMNNSIESAAQFLLKDCGIGQEQVVHFHINGEVCVRGPSKINPDDEGTGPAEVPLEYIKEGLIKGGGLSPQFPHLESIAKAAQTGIRDTGRVEIAALQQGQVKWIAMSFNVKLKYLSTGKIKYYSEDDQFEGFIKDLSKVDTTIKQVELE